MECGYFTIPIYITQPLIPNSASHSVILFIIMDENVEPYYENGFIQEMNIIMGENQRLREKLEAQAKVTNDIVGENVSAFIQELISEELAAVQAQQEVDIIKGEHVKLRENLALAQAQIKDRQENRHNQREVIMDQMDHDKRIRIRAAVIMLLISICCFAFVLHVWVFAKLTTLADLQANVTRLQEITGQNERENDVNQIISTTDTLDLERKNVFHNFVASSQYYKMRTQEDGKHRTSGSGVHFRNFFLTLNLDKVDDKVMGNQINPIHLSSLKSAVTGNRLKTGINISNMLAVQFIPLYSQAPLFSKRNQRQHTAITSLQAKQMQIQQLNHQCWPIIIFLE